jgi:hypothetical protein
VPLNPQRVAGLDGYKDTDVNPHLLTSAPHAVNVDNQPVVKNARRQVQLAEALLARHKANVWSWDAACTLAERAMGLLAGAGLCGPAPPRCEPQPPPPPPPRLPPAASEQQQLQVSHAPRGRTMRTAAMVARDQAQDGAPEAARQLARGGAAAPGTGVSGGGCSQAASTQLPNQPDLDPSLLAAAGDDAVPSTVTGSEMVPAPANAGANGGPSSPPAAPFSTPACDGGSNKSRPKKKNKKEPQATAAAAQAAGNSARAGMTSGPLPDLLPWVPRVNLALVLAAEKVMMDVCLLAMDCSTFCDC